VNVPEAKDIKIISTISDESSSKIPINTPIGVAKLNIAIKIMTILI